jgi:hypothetical protein
MRNFSHLLENLNEGGTWCRAFLAHRGHGRSGRDKATPSFVTARSLKRYLITFGFEAGLVGLALICAYIILSFASSHFSTQELECTQMAAQATQEADRRSELASLGRPFALNENFPKLSPKTLKKSAEISTKLAESYMIKASANREKKQFCERLRSALLLWQF